MTDPDAYQGEMTNPFGPTDEALEGIYAGVAPTEDLEEVAAFMLEVKTTCSAAPREETAGRHIAAILEESRRAEGARPLTQEAVVVVDRTRWRRVMDRTISTVLKGAAGVLAASMSMMGLAYAGADLPDQAASAITAVTGVDLPNQESNDKAVADAVQDVIENSGLEGCELGQAVAAAASQNAQDEGPSSEEDPCVQGEERSAEGRAKAAEKSAEGRAKAAEKSAEGKAKASENSGGASDAGSDNATTGADNATKEKATAEDNRSGAGTDTDDTDTDDNDADGGATASDKSGGASDRGSDNRP